MLPTRLLRFLLPILFLVSAFAFGQKEDWLPVTPQDLQVKDVPGQPGASAIQLYYTDQIDDPNHSEFIYSRVKILNEKGMRPRPEGYADVEIRVMPHFSIRDIKARTIHPDGSIVEFTGKPFDKTIVKGKGFKYTAKTFTMPDVTVGSIIEYKFRQVSPDGFVYDNSWEIQHELYTVKEHYSFKPIDTAGQFQVSYVVEHSDMKPQKQHGMVELDAENVAAFDSEANMPPENNYKPRVEFYYLDKEVKDLKKFWADEGKTLAEAMERYIGNHKEARDAATEAIGSETDPEKKLRKIYARAQQIRNLTYERERTEVEQKKEKLKDNGNLGEVFKRGFGDRDDITRAFVAMARAAGFDASVVLVSNREERFFQENVLSTRQLDSEIASVSLNGKDVYFDPGTKFCPFGIIRWMRTATTAIKLDKKGGTFVTTPSEGYDKAKISRGANVALSPDGSISGEILVRFEGGEALEHRLDALETDEAGRTKNMENELRRWLSGGAIVKVTSSTGWDSTDGPLEVHYEINMPGYASAAGKRLMIPVFLFQSRQMNAFQHAERKYPIYFPYAFTEADRVIIRIPPGFSVEGAAPDQTSKLAYAGYQIKSSMNGNVLTTDRTLLLNGIFFNPKNYPELKDFFGKVQAGDEQQAVLRLGGGTVDASAKDK